jgi:pilus assembly protein Flp/PilA
MTRLRGMFARIRKSEDGATMIEYSILIGIITAATITFILAMGDFVTSAWSDLCTNAATVTTISISCP